MHKYTITALNIYPVKGLAGIALPQSLATEKGLLHDRQWMLITSDDNTFISQRAHAVMALLKPTIVAKKVEVRYMMDTCTFGFDQADTSVAIEAVIWNDRVTVYEVDQSISEWFSNILKVQCKLVTMADNAVRNKLLINAPQFS
jgi:uncharacterized protein